MCLSSSVYFWLMSMWSYGFSLICSFAPSNGHLNSILLIARILWIGDYIELGLNRLIGYDIRKDEEEFMSTSQDFWILANSAMWQDVLYIKILSHTLVLCLCYIHVFRMAGRILNPLRVFVFETGLELSSLPEFSPSLFLNLLMLNLTRECLKLIPHDKFSFAKIWLMAGQFEIRQLNLKGARQILGNAIGKAPKDKVWLWKFCFNEFTVILRDCPHQLAC